MSREKIDELIRENNLEVEVVEFKNTVSNSKDSAKEVGCKRREIVKTVLFVDRNNQLFAVILRGNKHVNTKVIKKRFTVRGLNILKFDQVLPRVGFPPGGVVPFGFDAKFIIDSDLKDDDVIFVGGGTINSLLKIKVSEIKRMSNPVVLEVGKKSKKE